MPWAVVLALVRLRCGVVLCLYVCDIISLYYALLYGGIALKIGLIIGLLYGGRYLFFVHVTILPHLAVQRSADFKNLLSLVNADLTGYISLKTMQRSVVFPPSFQIVRE